MAARGIWHPSRVLEDRGASPAEGPGLQVRPAAHPTLIESDYAHRLVAIVGRIRHAARHVVEALPRLLRSDGTRADADDGRQTSRLIQAMRAEAAGATSDVAVGQMAAEYARRTAVHQRAELQRQLEDARWVNISIMDRRLPGAISQFIHENVALVRRLQGDALGHLEALIYRGLASGMDAEELGGAIADRLGIAERHARLIARDQIQKLDSKVTELRHAELGIRSFVWWSMQDDRVRPRHRSLHGKTFAYSDPPADGLPGQPVGCRCRQAPVLDQQVDVDHGAAVDQQRAAHDAARAALEQSLGPRVR